MLRLIRGARSFTISDRTNRWRWRGELTRKMIGVIPAFGVLKRLMMPSLLPCWFSNEGGRRVAVTNIERYPGIHTVSIRSHNSHSLRSHRYCPLSAALKTRGSLRSNNFKFRGCRDEPLVMLSTFNLNWIASSYHQANWLLGGGWRPSK